MARITPCDPPENTHERDFCTWKTIIPPENAPTPEEKQALIKRCLKKLQSARLWGVGDEACEFEGKFYTLREILRNQHVERQTPLGQAVLADFAGWKKRQSEKSLEERCLNQLISIDAWSIDHPFVFFNGRHYLVRNIIENRHVERRTPLGLYMLESFAEFERIKAENSIGNKVRKLLGKILGKTNKQEQSN
jgi:hypothetical protein